MIGRAAIADALSGLVVFLAASFASFCVAHRIKRVTKVIRPFVAEDILVSHAPKQVEDLQSAREPVTAPLLNLDRVICVLRHGDRLPDGLVTVKCPELVFRYSTGRQAELFRIGQREMSDLDVSLKFDLVTPAFGRSEKCGFPRWPYCRLR